MRNARNILSEKQKDRNDLEDLRSKWTRIYPNSGIISRDITDSLLKSLLFSGKFYKENIREVSMKKPVCGHILLKTL
jgi:hypothetical protein